MNIFFSTKTTDNEYDKKKTVRLLTSYVDLQDAAIEKKSRIIVEHFASQTQNELEGKAFSGTVKDSETNEEYTEKSMNGLEGNLSILEALKMQLVNKHGLQQWFIETCLKLIGNNQDTILWLGGANEDDDKDKVNIVLDRVCNRAVKQLDKDACDKFRKLCKTFNKLFTGVVQ